MRAIALAPLKRQSLVHYTSIQVHAKYTVHSTWHRFLKLMTESPEPSYFEGGVAAPSFFLLSNM